MKRAIIGRRFGVIELKRASLDTICDGEHLSEGFRHEKRVEIGSVGV